MVSLDYIVQKYIINCDKIQNTSNTPDNVPSVLMIWIAFLRLQFLPRCRECRCGLAMRILSVRPSIRLSVRLSVCYTRGL